MTVHNTIAVERYEPVLSEVEQMTLLGFLAGYRGFTRDAYTLDLRQFTACAGSTTSTSSTCAESTSNVSPVTWKHGERLEPPSPADSAP